MFRGSHVDKVLQISTQKTKYQSSIRLGGVHTKDDNHLYSAKRNAYFRI